MQFRSGNHLHRRGCSRQLLTLFIRLRNPSIEREGCSIYATSSLLINAGKGILCKRNGNGFLCSYRQEYPLESAQAVIWHGTVCIALDIELNHLFCVETALIFRCYNRNAVFIVQIRADNCSIGQPIAERIQNIFLRIAIGSMLHGIVCECWQFLCIRIERYRQLSRRRTLAEQQVCQCRSALRTRIPCLYPCFCFQLRRNCTARCSYQNNRCSSCLDFLEQYTLRFWQP